MQLRALSSSLIKHPWLIHWDNNGIMTTARFPYRAFSLSLCSDCISLFRSAPVIFLPSFLIVNHTVIVYLSLLFKLIFVCLLNPPSSCNLILSLCNGDFMCLEISPKLACPRSICRKHPMFDMFYRERLWMSGTRTLTYAHHMWCTYFCKRTKGGVWTSGVDLLPFYSPPFYTPPSKQRFLWCVVLQHCFWCSVVMKIKTEIDDLLSSLKWHWNIKLILGRSFRLSTSGEPWHCRW